MKIKNNKEKNVITFLLPGRGSGGPVGGFKVVYEYANRLVRNGFAVRIVYPLTFDLKKYSILQKIKRIAYILKLLKWGNSCRNWFHLEPEIEEKWVLSLNQRHMPESDIYVATAIQTAIYLRDYNIDPKRVIYLIQGYETWSAPEKDVLQSYGFGFNNIAVSDWLARILHKSGNPCIVLKNGFDFNYFQLTNAPENRHPHTLAMMYHTDSVKGSEEGLRVINRLKQKYPDMRAVLFGRPSPGPNIPKWITYYKLPDQATHNRIYNEAAVYLAPSRSEGWGLTVGEAMICGSAVVCTDTDGFKEMVTPGENGLMSSVSDEDALFNNVSELFANQELRIKLAKNGVESIKKFNWDNSANGFISLAHSLSKR